MGGYTVDQLKSRHGERWRWYAVSTVIVTTMATILSATAINVALPDIMVEFSLSQGQVHWLATGYLAAMTISMLCATWVLDRFGMRKSTLACVMLFSLVSILGGLSSEVPHLFIARIVLGVIAGLMQPMAMYLVFRTFPREERGSVLGFYGFGIILAPALAPVLGGFLVEYFNWRYVFYAPVPVTLLAIVLAWFFLPIKILKPEKYPFDILGLIFLTVGVVFALDSINSMHAVDTSFYRRLGSPALTVFALFLFIRHQRSIARPLLNIGLLMRKQFLYAGAGAFALGFTMFGSTYLLPVYTQTALNFTPTDAGLVMLPAGVVLGVTLLFTSRLTDSWRSKHLLFAGMLCACVSAFLLSFSTPVTTFLYVAIAAVLGRVGMAFMLPSVSTGALNQLSPDELGDGSSTISFLRQLGGVLGINFIALIIDKFEAVPSVSAVLPLGGFTAAWIFMGVIVLALMIPVSRLKS